MGQGGWGPFKGLLGLPSGSISQAGGGQISPGAVPPPTSVYTRETDMRAGCIALDEWRRGAAVTWQAEAIEPCLVAAIAQSHDTGQEGASWVDDDARKSSNKGFELRHQRLAVLVRVLVPRASLATCLLKTQHDMTTREQGQPTAREKRETRRVRPAKGLGGPRQHLRGQKEVHDDAAGERVYSGNKRGID
ncbi:hypothetical protein BBK36DRAFT_1144745 [Trichoderma citrinoviride]|uniref:Uncharacterized protein n=1 Tax=Trichoderma citrinoviride TaxID=58853 RepID=A0A2T4AZ05_9HYPO|nr:hypothetical protein BBK36DRAFT_1144745 [Trichoderma citrinoviride]PTB62306.1 hypothetical protein BBK36DRAFT_1144745 [Trichoderma citrinoviride]